MRLRCRGIQGNLSEDDPRSGSEGFVDTEVGGSTELREPPNVRSGDDPEFKDRHSRTKGDRQSALTSRCRTLR